jgi:hypothetical protein
MHNYEDAHKDAIKTQMKIDQCSYLENTATVSGTNVRAQNSLINKNGDMETISFDVRGCNPINITVKNELTIGSQTFKNNVDIEPSYHTAPVDNTRVNSTKQ